MKKVAAAGRAQSLAIPLCCLLDKVRRREVPVTVNKRLHGHSKKPAVFRYGVGFANAIARTWLR